MPFNLLKKYPELLEILHMNEHQRKESLMRIYKRDIEDNQISTIFSEDNS